MEVKINREIRNYTEAVFFGLSLRQIIFSVCALAVSVGVFFLLKPTLGTETTSWICIIAAAPFAAGLCQIQRNDRREIHCRLGEIRISYPQKADIQINEYLLRADEARN